MQSREPKTFCKRDVLFFLLTSVCAWQAAIDYTTFHLKVQGHCFLFARIFEMKRRLIPGPSSCCRLLLFSHYFIGALSVWLAFRCYRNPDTFL